MSMILFFVSCNYLDIFEKTGTVIFEDTISENTDGLDETPDETPDEIEDNSEVVTSNPNENPVEENNNQNDDQSDDQNSSENEEENTSRIADSDGDGLTDQAENIYGTDPNNADTDNDGLDDLEEFLRGTDPNESDTDNDGIPDGEEIELGTDPTNADSDNDGIPDGADIANTTDSNDSEIDDTGNFWNWGDYEDCPDCDPSVFAGSYTNTLQFVNGQNSVEVCSTTFSSVLQTDGSLYILSSCTSTTGLDFTFVFDLQINFTCQYASPTYGCLVGTGSLTLPNGTTILNSFYSSDFYGGIITQDQIGPFSPYNINFGWRPIIQTPNGSIEYVIVFYGNLQ